MASKETFQEIFERYVTIIWQTFVAVVRGIGSFILKFVEVSGGFLRGLSYLIVACALLFAVVLFGYGFIFQTTGLSDSATFQAYREEFLKENLPRLLDEHTRDAVEDRQQEKLEPTPAQNEIEVK